MTLGVADNADGADANVGGRASRALVLLPLLRRREDRERNDRWLVEDR
jgi:hypothetical protein